jgi:hypothetical protein
LLQAHDVLLAHLVVVRVAVECECSVRSHFSCGGTICLFTKYISILDDSTYAAKKGEGCSLVV